MEALKARSEPELTQRVISGSVSWKSLYQPVAENIGRAAQVAFCCGFVCLEDFDSLGLPNLGMSEHLLDYIRSVHD